MRPIWNGMISFGLVNIPIGLYPATQDEDLHLHLLHGKDHGRIKNQRVCSVCGEILDYGDLVKGYEYEKGSYVTLTEEDMEKVKVEGTDRIVIDDFVDPDEIDPKYFEKPYYLLPGKKADAPYALLRAALQTSGKVGIARIVIRTRERLATVRTDGKTIMLDTMHFSDELREIETVPAANQEIGKREIDMATMLIGAMTSKFDAEKYHDTYREAVLEVIHEKVEGKEVVHEESHAQPTQVLDLMAFLKASIEKTEKGKQPAAEQPATKAKPAAKERAEEPKPATRKPAAAKFAASTDEPAEAVKTKPPARKPPAKPTPATQPEAPKPTRRKRAA